MHIVIATTPAEQEDLHNRLDDWRGRLYGATPLPRPALADPGIEIALLRGRAAVPDGKVVRRHFVRNVVTFFATSIEEFFQSLRQRRLLCDRLRGPWEPALLP